ncbi:MAG: carbon storage regulator [Planctomycetes bacterium]|nr:carbon storage regulator [Planctomycetota bacterium]NOG53511.1 carbon storage regulator CsrA [Planctomycetota bacterium]
MLVLSRQRDETIMIGDDIEITVVDIRGDKVRLGINAPTSIAVHRKEVYEAIKRENEQAARLLDTELDLLQTHDQLANRIRPGDSKTDAHEPKQAARTLLNHHLNPLKSRSA